MEEIQKRLGKVENDVSELKSQMSAIQATIPHLATKADVMDVRTAVAELRGEMLEGFGTLRAEMLAGFGALRAEMVAGLGSLRAEMSARDAAMIKWFIATALTSVGMAFTIAKFVH